MSKYELWSVVRIPGSAWSFLVSAPLFSKQNHLFIIGIKSVFWQSSISGTCVRNKCQAKCNCYWKPQIRLENSVTKGCVETFFVPIKSFSLSGSKNWQSGFCRLLLHRIIFMYVSRVSCIQQQESQVLYFNIDEYLIFLRVKPIALFPWINIVLAV